MRQTVGRKKTEPPEDDAKATSVALRLCLAYAVFAFAWIVLSDRLLLLLTGDPAQVAKLQTLKGGLFVAVTALLLFFLIRRTFAQIRSEKKQSRERLALLDSVIETMPVGVWLADAEGNIVKGNPAGQQVWAGARHVGMERYGEYKGWWHDTGERIAAEQWALARALRRGETSINEVIDIQCFDGRGKTILNSAVPLRDSKGKITGAIVINQDITERVRMEEQLRESEMLHKLFIEYSPVALAMFDQDMKYLAVSRRWKEDYGIEDRDCIGRSHYEIFPEVPERWKTVHRRCLQGASEKCDEDPFVRADGHTDWVRWEVLPWYRAKGDVGGIVIFTENINSYKEAERDLAQYREHLEELVDERTADLESFSYSVSHDLRAPLRAIGGFAGILLRRHSSGLNEEGQRYLDNIVEAADRMGRLIDDLLAFSRLGRRGVHPRPIALQKVLLPLREELAAKIGESGALVTMSKDLPEVIGDQTLLHQIFLNLLDNALTYRRPDVPPRVDVSWEELEGRAIIRVADNGIGIPLANREKIFAVFQRLHSEEEYAGTGIGLAIVRKAAELLNGRVVVESKEGQGSTFCVELPLTYHDSS